MTTMKALVKAKAEPGIWMSQEPIPTPQGDEVLIKIKRTAICGTDIHIYKWDKWSSETIPVPMIVGHEFSGVIEALGPLVARDDLKVGMRVSGEGHIIGNRSRAVRAGKYHLDPDTKGVGVNRPGAFAEFLTIPAFNVVKLPDDISDETASILDPLGNAVHTALAYDLIGEDVLVTGAGPIGIMAAAVARHVGARNVVITDMNDDRLALATKTTDVVPVNVTKEDLGEVMAKLGMTEGFDIGFEMSGAPQAFDQMVEKMIMGGRISMLGLPSEPFETNWPKIVLKALTIKGVYGREMFETWYRMLAMLQSGLDVSGVITHRFKVDDFQTAFDTMLSGKSGKVILEWD